MRQWALTELINDEQAQFFRDNGYLRIPGAVTAQELQQLQNDTQGLIDYGAAEVRTERGYQYYDSTVTGEKILIRIEYPVHRSEACKRLMGHPSMLGVVEKISGRDFISIGDALVVKMPGEGPQVAWHRDGGSEWNGTPQNFNVDTYLDEAAEDTCIWVIPGSNRWPDEKTEAWQGKDCEPAAAGAVPCLMKAGDVLLHDARVLHGSPRTTAPQQRRTLYYWFYPIEVVQRFNPTPGYCGRRSKFLQQCIDARNQSDCAAGEVPFDYRPCIPGDPPDDGPVSFIYGEHGAWMREP